MPNPEHPFRLDGRVAWVTGSSRGLGRAMAAALAAAGARTVVNCHRNRERGEETVAEIRAAGGEAMLVQGDATSEEEIARMADEIEAGFGPVDLLVVNATPSQPMRALEDYRWDEHQALLEAFVKSPFLLARRVVPSMKARGHGRLVNITSEVFYDGVPGFSAYVAAKGGQIGWSRSMSRELAPHGITVNTVAPGWIPVERHCDVPDDCKERYLGSIPVGRWGRPEDVAHAVLYFASDQASFVSGQTLMVNGGRTPW